MPSNHLNLEDFPNSAHAHELRRGLARLQFEAPLEAEYRAVHLRRMRLRVRIWHSVNVVVTLLFTVDQVRRTGASSVLSLVHMAALFPCSVALVWLAWSREYQRLYLPAARVLVTIFSALIAVFVTLALTSGRDNQMAPLTVILVGIFFFAGLMFRQALLASTIVIIAFAATAIAAHLALAMFLKSMVILLLVGGVVAMVYRDMERSHRRNFLERALIGELVTRDALSGLVNRRGFDEHLRRVWQHALRDQRTIAVLLIDIDHFKRYNDDLGHQAGDLTLRSVAKVIQDFARRPLDLAARYGGDELAVILYDLAYPHVQDVAQRLRKTVQNLEVKLHEADEGTLPEVTVSIGVGFAVPTIGRTPQGAVQLADEALYEAKRAGRNQVVFKGSEAYLLLETGAFGAAQKSRQQR
jgi:diguanylate cyclase (GGDEF)-like protein